ncbi:hypothetical protein CROQUDRAFT_650564 [Cronartium quercuum f. sp. fusiforme G11]|uniref:Uncharacterized protein n=1 Tax=Cronartium quercuum f. sp. fusiforme G11 TaxID=708437 RepID=A0A9P6NYZ7_9BASI|nr:hypothetical protein CROQUDRAFT_650564 [Cronartium quercuum f. sp. fusiforme G11]
MPWFRGFIKFPYSSICVIYQHDFLGMSLFCLLVDLMIGNIMIVIYNIHWEEN